MTKSKVFINFLVDKNDAANRLIEFDTDCTISNMLDKYLSETNSIQNKDPQNITFLYKNRLINNSSNINKTISQVRIVNNTYVKVI